LKYKETDTKVPSKITRDKLRGLLEKALITLVPVTCSIWILSGCASINQNISAEQITKLVFKEVWGYLLQGKEYELKGAEPFTDICYFAANLMNDGRITDTIARPVVALRDGSKPKIHLVIADLWNSSLMHFSLSSVYGIRPLLINDICRVSQDFDGVQIDFETVSPDDAQYFWDFLQQLRDQLPSNKMLSIAVPARTGEIFDAYEYWKIAPIMDRVVIMAYDEHWSQSSPGPVASLPWCLDVIDHALSVIENDKIVMGLPLYGRAWQDKKLAKALSFHNVQDIIAEKSAKTNYQSELGFYFEYVDKVVVKVFYDDLRSIREKLQLYASHNVKSVAFWRIGLGPSGLWNSIENAGLENRSGIEQGKVN